MKKHQIFSVLLGGLTYSVLASAQAPAGSWYVGENAGVSFSKVTHEQHVNPGDGWPNDLYINGNIDAAAAFSLLGGFRFDTHQKWLPYYSVGAIYTYALPAKLSGTVVQYSTPGFENYKYEYNIQRQDALAFVKATLFEYKNFMPFLSFGLGVAVNQSSTYDEDPVSGVTPRVDPAFQSHSSTQLSYNASAGIDYAVKNNFWIGVDYHYGSYGSAKVGPGVSTYNTEALNPSLTDNGASFSMYYFFDQGSTK